jgi:hypothetical protein
MGDVCGMTVGWFTLSVLYVLFAHRNEAYQSSFHQDLALRSIVPEALKDGNELRLSHAWSVHRGVGVSRLVLYKRR